MKIYTLLEEFHFLLEAQNITQMTVKDFDKVRLFLQDFVYDKLPEGSTVESQQVAGYIDQLRKPDVRKAITAFVDEKKKGYREYDKKKLAYDPVKSDRSKMQANDTMFSRAYGFGPEDYDRYLPVVKRNVHGRRDFKELRMLLKVASALETVGAYDVEAEAITDRETHSRISAFLQSTSGLPVAKLASNSTFNKYVERLLFKRQSEVQSAGEVPNVVKAARELDINAFIFLLSIQHTQKRQKESWASFLNPMAIATAKKSLNREIDKGSAIDSLVSAGFIEHSDSGYAPNWNNVREFQDQLLAYVTEALQAVTQRAARFELVSAQLGAIKRLLPNDFIAVAERRVMAIMKELTAEDTTGAKSVVNSYLMKAQTLNDLSDERRVAKLIKNNVSLSTLKVVAHLIKSMIAGSSDLDVRQMILRDMRPMLQNIGKQMKAPR